MNISGGVRFNASFGYLDPVRDRECLRIVDRVLVDKLEVLPSGEVRVHALRQGIPLTVVAERVVLCAGSYSSPAILQRSGIGDPELLGRVGIPVSHALAGVGMNLQDHPLVEMLYTRNLQTREAMQDPSFAARFASALLVGCALPSVIEDPPLETGRR